MYDFLDEKLSMLNNIFLPSHRQLIYYAKYQHFKERKGKE